MLLWDVGRTRAKFSPPVNITYFLCRRLRGHICTPFREMEVLTFPYALNNIRCCICMFFMIPYDMVYIVVSLRLRCVSCIWSEKKMWQNRSNLVPLLFDLFTKPAFECIQTSRISLPVTEKPTDTTWSMNTIRMRFEVKAKVAILTVMIYFTSS